MKDKVRSGVTIIVVILSVVACGDSENEKYLSLAEDLSHRGEWGKAVEQYDLALGLDQTIAETWYERGVALNSLGLDPDALNNFNEAIRLDPEHTGAHYERARHRLQAGQVMATIEDLDVNENLNSFFLNIVT